MPDEVPVAVRSRTVVLVGAGWLLGAVGLGATGLLRTLQPPAPQVILVGLTALLLAAAWRVAGLRTWLAAVDLRWLVALHLTRFVGAYFLVLHGRGALPYEFAVPGGWGDITVASLAALLLLGGPPRAAWRRAYGAWNVLGMADIVFVVVAAIRLWVVDPASMAAMLQLPLSLLVTFLVPLIIASHVVLAVRLARAAPPG